jgi:hypothetical protein
LAPSLFVFVDVHHFSEPIRPNAVIVNNTTIINRTRVINDIRRVDRNFDGSSRRVVVNEGPKVDVVARATGRTFTAKPITDVVRQTPVPEHIKRTGTIERPVLKEDRQTIEQRQRQSTTGNAQERQRTPSPTGREQPSNHQLPEQQRPEQGRPEQHPTTTPNAPEHRDQVQPQQPNHVTPERPVAPTGREQPHVSPPEQHPSVPQRPEQTRPEQHPTPPAHEQPLPPTGREQPHVSPPPEQHAPVPQKPEQVRPEHPTPQVPPERVVPPTGREVPKEQPHHEQPAVHEQPSVKEVPQSHEHAATPPSQERNHGQEKKDHPESP